MAVREPNGFFDPFLTSHYDDPAIIKAYGRPFLEVHRQSMQNCIPDFYVSGHDFYIDVLRENLQRALRGGMTAQSALDVAAQEWRQITAESGSARLRKQWSELLTKYPPGIKRLVQ
jgi:multiple sugar transport system substrate-binding protein